MKLKYRVKRWTCPLAEDFYIAQYRLWGIWMNINLMGNGSFFKGSSVICETFKEAKERCEKHNELIKRAKDWGWIKSDVVWEDYSKEFYK